MCSVFGADGVPGHRISAVRIKYALKNKQPASSQLSPRAEPVGADPAWVGRFVTSGAF
ncbi:hypothetical protein Pla123a_36510 [Posidoniimonas polymericola]|uniref:Uncharacterized protein n=1 Tax=Posidoniimonas polymericola TaxID=2528002 RepID=A0A5C5YDE8_9BACT|nr:hypothetical protein Pla123a_36510 [Posidoniimonas polymericola]